jgi:hypothetical protein
MKLISDTYRYYTGTVFPDDEIFVFGSNRQGVHGAGAAKIALQHYGAEMGVGVGLRGQSYAIPTRDYVGNKQVISLNLHDIVPGIHEFVQFTQDRRFHFFVTSIGCGFAGFKPRDIAPHFRGAKNCRFPIQFKPYLGN